VHCIAKRKGTHVASSPKEALSHVANEAALALLSLPLRLLLALAVIVAVRQVVVPPIVCHGEKHSSWLPQSRVMGELGSVVSVQVALLEPRGVIASAQGSCLMQTGNWRVQRLQFTGCVFQLFSQRMHATPAAAPTRAPRCYRRVWRRRPS